MNRSLLIALCSIAVTAGCGGSSEDTPTQTAPSPAETEAEPAPDVAPAPEPEAPAVALERAADGTYSCTEGNYTITGIYVGPADVANLRGPLITASGTCHLSLGTSTIFGDPAIKVEGNAQVTSTAVSYNATEEGAVAPIQLEGSATFTMTSGSSHARTDDSACAYIGAGTTLVVDSGSCTSGIIANSGGTFTDNGGSYWHRP